MAVSLAAPSNAILGMTQAVVATVSNFGPATATGVTATYFLPAGLSYISSVSSQGSTSFSNGTVTASLGTLASGATATFTINVSATGGIVASHTINVDATENDPDRTNNLATAFSTVGDVDLVPFQPPGWSDKLVVAQAAGIFTDSPAFLPANTYYLAWAVMNNGTISTNAGFSVAIYVDGTLYTTGTASSTLRAGYYFYWNYATVGLAPGTHTIRMVVDSGGTVPEFNETNNEYTKTITVPGVTLFDSFTGATLTSTGSTPRTFMGFPMTVGTAGGTSNISVTGGRACLQSKAAANCTNIRLNVTFWGTASGATSGATPAFSNSLGTYSYDFGPLNAGANNYYRYAFTLPAPVILPGQTGGITCNWQGDTGSGLVSTDNLTSLIRYGSPAAVGTLTLGTAGTHGYYRNVSSETDANFLGSSFRSISGFTNQGLALQLFGTSGLPSPVISSAGTAPGTTGQPFSYQIVASNSPTSYAAVEIPAPCCSYLILMLILLLRSEAE